MQKRTLGSLIYLRMMNVSERVILEETCFNTTKATYDKPTSKVFLEKKCEAILLKSGVRQVDPESILFFNIVCEVLAVAIR